MNMAANPNAQWNWPYIKNVTQSTLASTSKDDSKGSDAVVTMVNDTSVHVLDFDGIKNIYEVAVSQEFLKSADALFPIEFDKDDNFFLFEFKNGKFKIADVTLKMYDSYHILFELLSLSQKTQISNFIKNNCTVLIIYNREAYDNPRKKKSIHIFEDAMTDEANEPPVKIQNYYHALERFKRGYFKDVQFMSVDEFKKFMKI